jgi:hypothetical protein
MNNKNIELLVLIKGRPITQYHHQGNVFIEGRAGSEYEIELRNHTAGRVEVVLSVDGLSVIDGKFAGPQSSGYLLNAHGNIRVPGWILNNQSVAKFAFADKEQSYSTQMSEGEAHNNGVIGIMAFGEKPRYVSYPQFHYIAPYQPIYQNSQVKTVYDSVNCGTSAINSSSFTNSSQAFGGAMPVNSLPFIGASLNSVSASASSGEIHQRRVPNRHRIDESAREEKTSGGIIEQSLGTAFGEATNFATTKVSFERAEMISMMVVYYDEARGLRARGIEITKQSRKRHQKVPKAFPALQEGCQPPHGWKG